ncbi:hypothetical protein BD410DRAFT_809272 [Rickenella mellea]|uniref:Uncharacterized protein n=1 Tax=Rickenella mellea TaxID=50990 RepID=A0A4Y7PKQ2_9AGAM|nr:hypothetical protein BD410DRAFT_809272 [Rickenella mellea]
MPNLNPAGPLVHPLADTQPNEEDLPFIHLESVSGPDGMGGNIISAGERGGSRKRRREEGDVTRGVLGHQAVLDRGTTSARKNLKALISACEERQRPPTPLHTIFAVDVRAPSVVSGYTRVACEAVKSFLFGNGRHRISGVVDGTKGGMLKMTKNEIGERRTVSIQRQRMQDFYCHGRLKPLLSYNSSSHLPKAKMTGCSNLFLNLESLPDAFPSRFGNSKNNGRATALRNIIEFGFGVNSCSELVAVRLIQLLLHRQ